MTVTVIKPAPPKEVKCWKCKSILGYNYTDIIEVKSTDYDGSKDNYEAIKCPVCYSDVRVSTYD